MNANKADIRRHSEVGESRAIVSPNNRLRFKICWIVVRNENFIATTVCSLQEKRRPLRKGAGAGKHLLSTHNQLPVELWRILELDRSATAMDRGVQSGAVQLCSAIAETVGTTDVRESDGRKSSGTRTESNTRCPPRQNCPGCKHRQFWLRTTHVSRQIDGRTPVSDILF